MLGWGYALFLSKRAVLALGPLRVIVWARLFGTVILTAFLISACFTKSTVALPQTGKALLLCVLFGALLAAIYLLLLRGLSQGTSKLLAPLFSSYSGIAALVSIMFLREAVGVGELAALIVLFAGIILLSCDVEEISRKRIAFVRIPGVLAVAGGTLLAAVFGLWWDMILTGNDWLFLVFLAYAFSTVGIIAYAFYEGMPFTLPRGGNSLLLMFMIGLGEVVALVGVSYALFMTNHTSVILLISGAFALPSVILSRLYLNEQMTAIQVAGFLMVIGGILLIPIV